MLSEEARQQAQAEGLTLRVADNNKTGYSCVSYQPSRPRPYQAHVWHGGKYVHLGMFVTAEEAALCVARTPEGRKAAAKAAAAPPPTPALTSEEARQQAQAEGLTLLVAGNTTGYFGVRQHPGRPKPYEARVKRGDKMVHLGSFVTAEEAALCVARSPEGQAAEEKVAAAAPLTSEEVRQQAQAGGLTLRVADNSTGYFGVCHDQRSKSKLRPYEAQVTHGGKKVHLGRFATAEEAALSIARSPEGQASAQRAAAAPLPLTSDDDGGDATGEEGEEETVEVLDAVEVLVASDDEEEEALAMHGGGEEVALVVERKRAREHMPLRRGA